MPPQLSVIIPALNEEELIERCISFVEKNVAVKDHIEIIVVDAGSTDGTMGQIPTNIRVYQHPEFAGHKYKSLNQGAQYACGEYLLFLDVDTLVPERFDELIIKSLLDNNIAGGAFEFRFEERIFPLIIIEFCNRFRYRVRQSYYGDQGVFVRKSAFDQAGGYPPQRLMESAHLCYKLKKIGRLKLIKSKITTSGRRFISGGILTVFAYNIKIWILNFLGFDIQKYADGYWSKRP